MMRFDDDSKAKAQSKEFKLPTTDMQQMQPLLKFKLAGDKEKKGCITL